MACITYYCTECSWTEITNDEFFDECPQCHHRLIVTFDEEYDRDDDCPDHDYQDDND